MKSQFLSLRNVTVAVALLALLGVTGCSNKIQADPICPQTGFIGNTDTISYVTPDTHELIATGSISGFSGECKFKGKKSKELLITLKLPFSLRVGKAGATLKNKELPYFIAVLGPDETILQRTAFTTTVSFADDGIAHSEEEHVLKIPLPSREDAGRYKVIIGFVLTREQVKYNQDHKTDSVRPGDAPNK